MELENIKFILNLIQDSDLSSKLNNISIVDFEIINDKYIIIVRKDDKKNTKREYLKYIIEKKENVINIKKMNEAGYNVFYKLIFENNSVDLLVNFKKTTNYKLSEDFFSCIDINNIEILSQENLITSKQGNRRK